MPHQPGMTPISLAVGDPQRRSARLRDGSPCAARDRISASIRRSTARKDWREAAAGWLIRRFGLPAHRSIPTQICCRSTARAKDCSWRCSPSCPRAKRDSVPSCLLPNPFYQCYAAAALERGGEPVFVPATAATRLSSRFRVPAEADAGAHGGGLYLFAVQSRRRLRERGLLANAVRAGRPVRFHGVRRRMLCRHLSRPAAGERAADARRAVSSGCSRFHSLVQAFRLARACAPASSPATRS